VRNPFIEYAIPFTDELEHLLSFGGGLGVLVGDVPFAPAGPANAMAMVATSPTAARPASDFLMLPPEVLVMSLTLASGT
jgi:hypothetical protein